MHTGLLTPTYIYTSTGILKVMSDNDKSLNKTIIYPIIAACLVGIILIGVLAMKSDPSEGFSELYFDNSIELPNVVNAGDNVNFNFTVVSHENEKISYEYKATYDNKLIKSGTFTLSPGMSKSIGVDFAPKNSTLFQVSDPKITLSDLSGNALVGSISSRGRTTKLTDIVTSPNGYSVINWNGNNSRQIDVAHPGRISFPIDVSFDVFTNQTSMIILNPNAKEELNRSTKLILPMGNINNISSSDSKPTSTLGYGMKQIQWEIENDHGRIHIQQRNIETYYRYALKRVLVEVSPQVASLKGPKTQYEVHFWIIVKESPEKLLAL